jgi:hypothetical protein
MVNQPTTHHNQHQHQHHSGIAQEAAEALEAPEA